MNDNHRAKKLSPAEVSFRAHVCVSSGYVQSIELGLLI